MANFGQLVLTNQGIQMQYMAQSGSPLKFKRIAMGSGTTTGNYMALQKLVFEQVSVDISKGYIQNNSYTVEGFFSNEGLQTGFAWRELGLYVEDASGNEILYCYGNAGDSYDYIPATADERYSKYIRIVTVVGNASNVSYVENEGVLNVDLRTFNAAVEEFRTGIDQNHPSKNQAGDAILIEDSAEVPFLGMKLFGKSEQFTTTGKNLFQITATTKTTNGVTFTINDDGSVTANGTATASIYFELGVFSLANGNYIMSGCNKGSKSTYLLYTQKEGGSGYVDLVDGEKVFTISDSDERKLLIAVYNGTTVSNLKFYPMLSVEGGEYEPYTGCAPSPSPDYPQDIVSIGQNGDISIGVYGKNLLEVDKVTVENHQSFFLPMPLPTGKYTFSANIVSDDTDGDLSTVVFMNGSQNVAYIPLKRGDAKYTFIAKMPIEKVDFCAAYNYSQGEGDTATWKNIQLEYAETASECEESRTPQITTVATPNGLPGIPVSSGGNYTDGNGQQWICDEIDFARGVYVQRVYVYQPTTMNSVASGTKNNRGHVKLPYSGLPYPDGNTGICSHFAYNQTVYSDTANEVGFIISAQTLFFRFASESPITTTELGQAWMDEQAANGTPLTIAYILADPMERPLSASEIAAYKALTAHNPITTIFNDSGAGMEVEYVTHSHESIYKGLLERAAEKSTTKPEAVSVDLSTFSDGTFTETLADGSKVTYTVTFDESGNPININNGESDFAIVWG